MLSKYSVAYEKAALDRHLSMLRRLEYRHLQRFNFQKNFQDYELNLKTYRFKLCQFQYNLILAFFHSIDLIFVPIKLISWINLTLKFIYFWFINSQNFSFRRELIHDNHYDRQTGGSHAFTFPNKKLIKLPSQVLEENTGLPSASAPNLR